LKKTTGKVGPFDIDVESFAEANSLEVSKTAKGDYTYTFKVYFDLESLAGVQDLQVQVKEWFRKHFGGGEV